MLQILGLQPRICISFFRSLDHFFLTLVQQKLCPGRANISYKTQARVLPKLGVKFDLIIFTSQKSIQIFWWGFKLVGLARNIQWNKVNKNGFIVWIFEIWCGIDFSMKLSNSNILVNFPALLCKMFRQASWILHTHG